MMYCKKCEKEYLKCKCKDKDERYDKQANEWNIKHGYTDEEDDENYDINGAEGAPLMFMGLPMLVTSLIVILICPIIGIPLFILFLYFLIKL